MTQIAILRSFGGLTFDATFEEEHDSELSVTDNPVETGVRVSDHAFMNPLKLNISAGVSDTPLRLEPGDVYFSGQSRSKEAYDNLCILQARAEPFDVQTGLKLYKNMVITNLRVKQDKDTGNVIFFDASLREVIIVNTQTVTFAARQNARAGATKRQAGDKKDAGEQQAKEDAPPAKQSLLRKALSALK